MRVNVVPNRTVVVDNNSPIQDYVHPDDPTQPFEITPGFKPFTVLNGYVELKISIFSLLFILF